MAISIPASLTQRTYSWTAWKAIQALKSLSTQYDEGDSSYTIYGYDGPEIHVCTIYKGDVPIPIAINYSQSQNDSDKSDFESNYKPNANGTVAPRTRDGKNIYLPNLFPGNVMLYLCGCGDSSSVIGAGNKFKLTSSSGTQTIDFQFRDWVYLAGGGIFYEAASTDDEVTMKLWAPASTVSASSGGNTGNANLVSLGGGANMIVPAPGNGTHNVTNAILVPSYDEENGETPAGYWDWNTPDTGLGTVSANASGKGAFNLFSFNIDLTYFVRSLQFIGTSADGNFALTVPAIKPKKILPHWKFTVSLTNGSGLHTVKTGWYLVTARRKTV